MTIIVTLLSMLQLDQEDNQVDVVEKELSVFGKQPDGRVTSLVGLYHRSLSLTFVSGKPEHHNRKSRSLITELLSTFGCQAAIESSPIFQLGVITSNGVPSERLELDSTCSPGPWLPA